MILTEAKLIFLRVSEDVEIFKVSIKVKTPMKISKKLARQSNLNNSSFSRVIENHPVRIVTLCTNLFLLSLMATRADGGLKLVQFRKNNENSIDIGNYRDLKLKCSKRRWTVSKN